jgi:hypothetical protein
MESSIYVSLVITVTAKGADLLSKDIDRHCGWDSLKTGENAAIVEERQ